MLRRIKLYFRRRRQQKEIERMKEAGRKAAEEAAASIKGACAALSAFAEGLREARKEEGSEDDEA